ncbi:MAG: helix-turn-helix domain-containing protein [Treponema sp.]|nr:helix-turn-helix domain-containing protein [Treponema sp.]
MPKIGRRVKIFSALEVANICGVVNQTAINWIKNGHLKAFTTPGGQYRIYAKDLAAFLDTRGMGDSGEALQVILERADWNSILVATRDNGLASQLQEEFNRALPEYTIFQAFDGFELGLKLAGRKPGFIILDRNLPGVDPDRVFRIIKDPTYGTPYVFIIEDDAKHRASSVSKESAGSRDPEDSSEPTGSRDPEGSRDSPDRIFIKPLNLGALVEAIKSLEKQTKAIA